MFALSDSPVDKDLEWSNSGIDGCRKFISKLENLVSDILVLEKETDIKISVDTQCVSTAKGIYQKLLSNAHATIQNVTEDIQAFKLNRAIARIRELYNNLADVVSKYDSSNMQDQEVEDIGANLGAMKFSISSIVRLLNPFIPHITEELWQRLGATDYLYSHSWPEFDKDMLKSDSYTIAVQVNGKIRATAEFSRNTSNAEIEDIVCKMPAVDKLTRGKVIRKIIIVPNKIVNVVV